MLPPVRYSRYIASTASCLLKLLRRRWVCGREASTSAGSVERIRNIGISAHIDSGKTTVTERILYYAGRINEMHEVKGKDRVGATMDFMELERQRGITIQSAATHIDWKGTTINIIDTPGHVDFTVEVERALRVLDGAILVLCGVGGIQSQTFTVSRQMARYSVPFLTFVNKLDRLGASVYPCVTGLRSKLGHNAALIQLPIGKEEKFCGFVDLIREKAFYYEDDEGIMIREDDVPLDMRDLVNDKRAELIECASQGDETLGELYIEERQPSLEQLIVGIRNGTIGRKFCPVLCGSALKNKGVQPMLDCVLEFLPNPSQIQNFANFKSNQTDDTEQRILLSPMRNNEKPFVGLAFKLEAGQFGQLTYFRIYRGMLSKGATIINTRTGARAKVNKLVRMHANRTEVLETAYAGDICATVGIDCASGDTFTSDAANVSMESMHIPEPVISMSMAVKNSRQADNFMKALTRFCKEDPTFKKQYDPESRETVISGMGELHLEIYAQRMKNEYNCEVELGKPKVAFRETLNQPYRFNHLLKKQTGGAGQYGHVVGVMEPLPPEKNTEFDFVSEIVGGALPVNLIPPIEKGMRIIMEKGPLLSQPVVGICVRLQDGRFHEVDSTENAMTNVGKEAMRDAFAFGDWKLLEPIMLVEVTVPVEFHGKMENSLLKRNAVLVNQGGSDEFFVLECEAPLNDMFGYSTELRRLTQGKGEFTMEFIRYAPVPESVTLQLIKVYAEARGQEAPVLKKMKK